MNKIKVLSILSVLSLMLVMAAPGAVHAQAYTTSFTTSVTYMNVGSGATTQLSITFYPGAINIPLNQLNKNAGTSLRVGDVNQIGSGFQGAAVLNSDQPLIATEVQVPSSNTVKNRPLSNGFSAGSPTMLVATTLKNKFGSTSILSVQNVDSGIDDITVNFFNADNPSATPIKETVTLNQNEAKYYDLGKMSNIPDGFNGSATITAVKTGTTTAGAIVASVMELSIAGTGASAFEGVASGTGTVYMPSALCRYSADVQTSAYAVQNTDSAATAHVVVTYTDKSGNTTQDSADILPGTKKSFDGCTKNSPGFIGSAKVVSTGANVIVIGKIYGGGASTAFLGVSNSSAGERIALPYVRWSDTQYNSGVRQRTFIAIQNIGADLTAGAVTVTYLDKDGNVVGQPFALPAIPSGAKANSTPKDAGAAAAEFGYYANNVYGGSAVVQGPAGSKLVVIARINSWDTVNRQTVSEDYNGTPF